MGGSGVGYLHQGASVHLVADGHVLSSWNPIEQRPAEPCYTTLLLDAALDDRVATGDEGTVVVVGLGGGVLPARLARLGVPTVVVERDAAVIFEYERVYRHWTAAWVARDLHDAVDVYAADALRAPYEKMPRHGLAVVDIPACYRDASAECARLLHAFRRNKTRVVANVWQHVAPAFAELMLGEGAFVREDKVLRTLAWASHPPLPTDVNGDICQRVR